MNYETQLKTAFYSKDCRYGFRNFKDCSDDGIHRYQENPMSVVDMFPPSNEQPPALVAEQGSLIPFWKTDKVFFDRSTQLANVQSIRCFTDIGNGSVFTKNIDFINSGIVCIIYDRSFHQVIA